MSARTRLERCCGQPTPPELIADLDAYRAEVLAEAASRPERLRKTGYLVAQPLGGRFLVESFVVSGEECTPVNDTPENAAELAEAILRHFGRIGGTR
jgi:hypothetical protein